MVKGVKNQLSYKTTFRFLIVGVSTAGLYFLIYLFLNVVLMIEAYIASAIAYSSGFVVAYTSHKFWTYESNTKISKSLPRYFILQVSGLVLTSGGVQISSEYFELSSVIVSAIGTLIAGVSSYLLSTVWVFADARVKNKAIVKS